MKKKGTAIVAVLCGALCAAAVFAYTGSIRAEASAERTEALARYGGDQTEVCVATRDIAAGETLDAGNTASRQWLCDLLPEGAVSNLRDLAGKKTTSPIISGEVIVTKRFEESGSGVDVPAGLQAVTVELDGAQAVGDALDVGCVVDVYAAGAQGATLIVPRALVGAVQAEAGSKRTVTLAVEADCVSEVIAATQKSSLYLALPSNKEEDKDES